MTLTSREAQILSSIGTEQELPTPLTRMEQILVDIDAGEATITPVTDEEKALSNLIGKVGGSTPK